VAINATDFHLLLLLLQACNDDGKGHGINYERACRRRAASGDGGEGHAFNGGEALSLQVRRAGPRGDLNAVGDDRLSVVAHRTTASLLPTKLPARSQSDWPVFASTSDQFSVWKC